MGKPALTASVAVPWRIAESNATVWKPAHPLPISAYRDWMATAISASQTFAADLSYSFSPAQCAPCNSLAPKLEKFRRANQEVQIVMISKGEPKENRVKVKEHGLTFPIVLQQQ